jgi:hypothetical protein
MTKQAAKPTAKHSVKHTPAHASRTKQTKKKPMWALPYTKKNFIIALIGLGVVILGYLLMATGITEQPALVHGKWNNPFAVDIAPIILVIGYCVIIPYAIMKYFGNKNDTDKPTE